MRAWLRLARWRLRRSWQRLRVAAMTSKVVRSAGSRPRRGPRAPAGWPLRALLWALAAVGMACPLLALAVICPAALRAPLAVPAPSLLLLDRQGRFLGELPGGTAARARGTAAHLFPARISGSSRSSARSGRAASAAGGGVGEEGLGYWPGPAPPPRVG